MILDIVYEGNIMRPEMQPDLHVVNAPLSDILKSVIHHIYVARDAEGKMGRSRLKAGREMLRLRERVDVGDPEAEGLSWWDYYNKHLKAHLRSRKDAEKIMALARADDPEQAAEQERADTRGRMRRHRSTAHVRGDQKLSQDELLNQACTLVREMSDATRQKFFAVIKTEYDYA
jgi:hypothetical protein